MEPVSLGSRIRTIRQTIGNQVTFAAMMGISQQYLSALEKGQNENPSDTLLLLIEAKTGFSARWVRTGEGAMVIGGIAPQDILQGEDRVLLERCRKYAVLTEAERADVRGIFRLLAEQIEKKLRDRSAVNQEQDSKDPAPAKRGA